MGLLFVVLLCVAIHSEIVSGAWNGLFERIFDTIHIFITDDEMALNEMFSSGKSSPGKAEENCKTKTRERDVWHHLLAESFYNFKEAVDILKMFAREFTEGYVKELFLEFYGAQNDTRNNTLIGYNCCTLKLMEARRFVDDAIRCLSEPSVFQSYENKPQPNCIHSMVCADFVWRTLSPNNNFNDMVVVVVHTAFTIESSHSNLRYDDSAKRMNSSDSLHGFNKTGITFENISWEVKIIMVLENHYTEIFMRFLTYSGRLPYNSFLENQRIDLYKNTTESFSEINFHIYDSLSYDAYCCLKTFSEFEYACGYKIQPFLTLNVCVNGTAVAFLTHKLFLEKYFTAVYSCRMSGIKRNGSYIYTCPLVQFINVNSTTIIGYFVSKNKFFYRSRLTFPANISFCKIDVKDCIHKDIFTLHSSKNITFSSNILQKPSILKEVFIDCLCVCSVCNISYAYLFISDCAIRNQRLQFLNKTSMNSSRSTVVTVLESQIYFLNNSTVFENNSRIDMPKWKIDVSNNSVTYRCNMFYTEHPNSDSNITDLSASLNNSISRNVSYMSVKLENSPWKLNKDHHVLMFAIFSTRIIGESYGRNKTVCKNSTRKLVKCMNTGDNTCCFTIFRNLNYSGISLIQKAILSSYNASTRSSSILKEELWDSLKCCFSWIFCNILIGFLFLKFQTFKFMSDYDKENHNFQSCSQSTKFSPLDVTGTLKELDNIRAVGYLDHTIHVFFVTEIVVEAFILGFIWKFQFFPCFMDTLNRRRNGSELLNKLNFKIQIKSVSLHLCIKYNSPTNGITQIQTRVPDLNGSKESSYEETCQNERSMCTSKYNFADCSLFSTTCSSLSFSETEDSDDEDLHWKSKTDNCDDAQTLKYDTDSLKEMLENRKMCESYGIHEYDYHVSQKRNIELTFVKCTDDHDSDQNFLKYQQSLLNEDGEDNETSLKTIEKDPVATYLDSSLSGDIDDLNDPNISPTDRLKPNESINSKGLSSGKKCIEIKRIGDCIFSCNEFINTGKDFDNVHIYSDIDDNSLNAMSTFDSNKMKSKRNDSVVLSSLRSRPTSCRFENVDYHHRCIDFKHNSHKQFRNQAKETCVFPTAINIVTSSSKNKETQWCPNITTSPCIYIAQGVRKFLKRYRTRQRRRFLQTIRQYTSRFQDIKTEEIIICYPVFAEEASSNTTDQRQVSLPLPESSQAQGLQNVLAENQCTAYQSSDYESSLGTLSSIFNDVSIQSLNENDRYQYEWIRLASFSNFSSETVHATRLARGGWYSTGNGDQTVCFSCHKIHDNWVREDDPSGSTLHDPNCRFMLRISNNRSIPRESTIHRDLSSESLLNENTTRDHTEPANQHMNSEGTSVLSETLSSQNTLPFTNAPSEDRSETHLASQTLVAQAATSEGTRESQLEALMRDPMGINFDRPKYPSYAILAVRVSSFSDWPASMTQTPRDMALAGFFYAGHGDYTRCFFCGGGLRNWEAGDDPWVEHARWFSKCAFVRQNRGQQFIDLVLRRAAEMEQQQTEYQQRDTTENKKAKEARIMNSAAVRSIKDMGYSEEKIKEAIDTIKSRLPRGKHKVSAHEILEVLFELADRSSRGVTQPSEPALQQLEPTVANQSYENQSSTNLTPNTNEGATSTVNNLTLNDLESLQRENTSLKDQIVCKICMEKNVSIAFLPCGHLACCADCAPAMRKCPICREFVRGTVKTYLV
ncbi:uncharacterized protein LOC134264784 isoform X2 [Saccostrea cucullata]|uniref:uncharacterized protein LOC134264784 isoform X2 n=1 Tax=Saccostrea cuccullata TaxID=36930 RepID=UPI002ED40A6C